MTQACSPRGSGRFVKLVLSPVLMLYLSTRFDLHTERVWLGYYHERGPLLVGALLSCFGKPRGRLACAEATSSNSCTCVSRVPKVFLQTFAWYPRTVFNPSCPFETERVSTLFIKSQSARAGAPSHVGLYSIDAIIIMVYSELKAVCINC